MSTAKVKQRLNKVAGQVHALSGMIETEKDCTQVVIQFKAAKAALESAMSIYMETYAHECVQNKDEESLKKIISEITRQ